MQLRPVTDPPTSEPLFSGIGSLPAPVRTGIVLSYPTSRVQSDLWGNSRAPNPLTRRRATCDRMVDSLATRTVSVVLVVLLVFAPLWSVSGAATSSAEFAEQPTDLAAVHDGMSGSGTEADPYEVSNLHELQAVTVDVDAHYVLVEDIDARPTRRWANGAGFTPIGTGGFGEFPMSDSERSALGFQGHFDGNGHEIRGLWINRDRSDIGLFGAIGPGGTVEQLSVRGAEIDRGARNGVVAGLVVSGEIRNVSVTESTLNRWHYQGGIAGVVIDNSRLENVSFHGQTPARGLGIGGIVGWLSDRSEVYRCQVDVEMEGDNGPSLGVGPAGTGGVVGVISHSTVSQCGASVDIDAPSQNRVGGLVGVAPNPDTDAGWWDRNGLVPGHEGGVWIRKSYVQGPVVGEDYVGGMIGFATTVSENPAQLEKGYVASEVTATDPSDDSFGGKFVGPIYGGENAAGDDFTPVDAYYDRDRYPFEYTDPENVSGEGGLRGGEMQGTTATKHMDGFNFTTTWSTVTTPPSYPVFHREAQSDSPIDLSWRLFDLAKLTGEYLAFVAGASGLIGLTLSKRPPIQRRSKGLLVGSAVGLLTIALVGGIFEAISWMLTDGGVPQRGVEMFPPILRSRDIFYRALPIVSVLSQVSAIIGAAGVSLGAGLWAISGQSSIGRSSKRSIWGGITLMIASVGGRLLSVVPFIVFG